ncbi:hypothetical protein [Streptomyces sp. NPDC049040]|uniref:hypothetical protein n=1 Tax=Streptomyces sp. NPDC049040 TaxID=3365593 RepID=UPI00371E20AB
MTERPDAEEELRILLERAVPQPPAPPQRLALVKERVRRRRRRRTAAVTGSAVLAVAAALASLPGLVRPDGGGAQSVAVATSGQDEGRPSPTASTVHAPTPTGTTSPTPATDDGFRPDGMDGLRLRPPTGWRILADPATTSVFLSTQTLVLPENGCAHALDGFCTPLARVLAKGGVLVMFRREEMKGEVDKLQGLELPLADEDPYQSCRTINGTRQMSRTMVGPERSGTMVWATACLSHPTAAQLDQVRDLLSSADFG